MNRFLESYLHQTLICLPIDLIRATRHSGWRGTYLVTCARMFWFIPFPVRIGRMGPIGQLKETLNLIDNVFQDQIRNPPLEEKLAATSAPLVIDIGVNVGVTVRWWLSLNPQARVIGIDMMEEALAYTRGKLEAFGQEARFRGICAAVGETRETREVYIDNPLEGTSSLLTKKAGQSRQVTMNTLDALLPAADAPEIFLLKMDIEGYAGPALEGAAETLARCRHVVIETHGHEETGRAAALLHRAGLELSWCHGRQMWWSRA